MNRIKIQIEPLSIILFRCLKVFFLPLEEGCDTALYRSVSRKMPRVYIFGNMLNYFYWKSWYGKKGVCLHNWLTKRMSIRICIFRRIRWTMWQLGPGRCPVKRSLSGILCEYYLIFFSFKKMKWTFSNTIFLDLFVVPFLLTTSIHQYAPIICIKHNNMQYAFCFLVLKHHFTGYRRLSA